MSLIDKISSLKTILSVIDKIVGVLSKCLEYVIDAVTGEENSDYEGEL